MTHVVATNLKTSVAYMSKMPAISRQRTTIIDGISILHISDLHMGVKSQGWLLPGLKRALFDDMERVANRTGGWDLVLFSGDLTQTGSHSEFDALDAFIQEMWEQFAKVGTIPKLFPVPGNHDLTRPPDRDPTARQLALWHTEPDVRAAFWDRSPPEYRGRIEEAFANYSSWIGKVEESGLLPEIVRRGLMPGDMSAVLEVRGSSVGLIGLNSTWLQLQAGDYQGRLNVDPRQLMALTNDDPDAWCASQAINIVVTHHPPEWLSCAALDSWRSEIHRPDLFDLHVFGHMHEAKSFVSSEGGFGPRRSHQAPSLFGLEYFGETETRLHGYSVLRFSDTETGVRTIRHWPRKAVKGLNGAIKLAPNIEFDLIDDFYYDDSYVVGEARVAMPNSARTSHAELQLSPKINSNILQAIRHVLPGSASAAAVREVEQAMAESALRESRVLWLTADWGQGADQFLRAVQDRFPGSELLFRIDCANYFTTESLIAGIKSQLGCSFEELLEVLSLQQSCILILDDIRFENSATGIGGASSLSGLIRVILEYCDNTRIVVRSQHGSPTSDLPAVALRSLDEADTYAYICQHPLGGKKFASSLQGSQVFRHTDGVPARIESTLRDVQIVGASQLHTLNPDVAGKAAPVSAAAPGLASAIEALSSAAGAAGPFGLLKALTMFPKGEQLSTLRRFFGGTAIYPGDAIRLADLGLVDSIELPTIGEHSSSDKALFVRRPVRDFLFATLSEREIRRLNAKALETYFGGDWTSGTLRTSAKSKFDSPACGDWLITNASTLVLRELNDAIDGGQASRVKRAYTLCTGFGEHLQKGDHFHALMSFWSDALPLLERRPDQGLDVTPAKLQHATSMRMAGFADRAAPLLFELADDVSRNADKQSVYLNLALYHKSTKNIDLAIDAAKKCIKAGARTNPALHAEAILVDLDKDNPQRSAELLKLEQTARKKGALVVAGDLAIERAKSAPPSEARAILTSVTGEKGSKVNAYQSMRAHVKLAQLKVSQGEEISRSDLERMIDIYHYLYSENFPAWFNDCHNILWVAFEARGEVDNLMRLFRYSSLKWRMRSQESTEQKYLGSLGKVLGDLANANILTAGRELGYFKTRAMNSKPLQIAAGSP